MLSGTIKGFIDVGLPSRIHSRCPLNLDKTIFRRFAESIIALEREILSTYRTEIHIPLLIMTNEFNRKHIESGFQANNFYGLQEDQIVFFSQGSFPYIDDEGSCLMREKYRVFLPLPCTPDCSVAQR
ncbi:uncharacterized protein [Blastocystis hominis]|uniref:Uncharacterized protein n=1 Tax=Blastocystis hominis TaxID=12968 RepID=D8MBV8_BLAHO|nr:uncharacterized protein [Blastocystis hominis]CBK25547.2 unnamed protein product [Blastocystis hominis]|eukprot:XP_012899595.1 uncharacterized protein [Blastocystis hominis]